MEPSTSLCCGENAAQILNSYHEFWNNAHENGKYKGSSSGRNPAPQPASLEREHLDLLLKRDYMVSDKSDGMRYILFLTRASGREIAVMIDRKLKTYQIPVAASKSHFAGSMYDGELVNCEGSHVFLVFDCICHKGQYMGESNYLERLTVIRSVFDLEGTTANSPEEAAALAKKGKIICGGSFSGLCFKLKQCFQMKQLDTLLRQIPTLPYSVDGLVFTPVDDPIKAGNHDTLFKFKYRQTIDVEVSRDGSEILVGMGGGNPKTADERTPISCLGYSVELDEVLAYKLKGAAGCILELLVTLEENTYWLSFMGMRTDKSHPNSVNIVLKIFQSIKENITLEEILEVAQQAASEQDIRKACEK